MCAVLGHEHADRRQLADLVATEPPARPLLLSIEPAPASATRPRKVINDLIHLILRLELTTRTQVPRPPTSRSSLTLAADQLLRLRARLRAPLRPRLRRISRRRLGARTRTLPRSLLKPLQSILVLSDPVREIENELDTGLTP